MTEAERLYQIHAYLDVVYNHLYMMPEKASPRELEGLAERLRNLGGMAKDASKRSIDLRLARKEADERVSAMIPSVS